MPNPHALADKVGVILLQKVERRLEALLAEHGASDPGEPLSAGSCWTNGPSKRELRP
jgi:hypothetical protein